MTSTEVKPRPQKLANASEGYYGSLEGCLFNLVIYVPDATKHEWLRGIADHVVSIFPSRIVFLEQVGALEGSQPETIISGPCTREGNGDKGHEEVSIRFQPEQRHQVPFMALPYLLPDIPVLLVWGEDPTQEPDILPHFVQAADRLIFDSDTSDNLQRFSHNLLAQREKLDLNLVDFNWVRIKGWRTALHKVFDTPEQIEDLKHASEIVISYNHRQDHPFQNSLTQAIYLQAWLAAQLGWRTRSVTNEASTHLVTYANGSVNPLIRLVPKCSEGHRAGTLICLDITTSKHQHYKIERVAGTCQASVSITSPEACQLPFTVMLRRPQRRFQFFKELFYSERSSIYFKMLRILTQQDWSDIHDTR